MSEQWKVDQYSSASKQITLIGPSDGFYPQRIYLDFDDVNHPEIERRLPLIRDALNAEGIDWGPKTDD